MDVVVEYVLCYSTAFMLGLAMGLLLPLVSKFIGAKQ